MYQVTDRPPGIEQPQRRRARLQRIHRMAGSREALHHVAHPGRPTGIGTRLNTEPIARQLTPDQQERGLEKTAAAARSSTGIPR